MVSGRSSRVSPGHFPVPWRAAAALLTGVLATGCGAGFNASSVAVRPNSGTAQNGILKVNNVWVVVDPATRNAEVIGAIANTSRSADRLTSVKAGGLPAVVRPATPLPIDLGRPVLGVTVEGDTVLLAGRAAVSFGEPGGPELELPDAPFGPGRFTRVEMDFQLGGPVSMNALVMANTGLFAQYNPNGANPAGSSATPRPSATGSATPGATAAGAGSGTATGTATGTASASASPTASP
jgi:hypothetical protein